MSLVLVVQHRDPCVTTVYDLMLEVDVVQRPRFLAKVFSCLTSTAWGDLRASLKQYIISFIFFFWVGYLFDAFSV